MPRVDRLIDRAFFAGWLAFPPKFDRFFPRKNTYNRIATLLQGPSCCFWWWVIGWMRSLRDARVHVTLHRSILRLFISDVHSWDCVFLSILVPFTLLCGGWRIKVVSSGIKPWHASLENERGHRRHFFLDLRESAEFDEGALKDWSHKHFFFSRTFLTWADFSGLMSYGIGWTKGQNGYLLATIFILLFGPSHLCPPSLISSLFLW